MVPDIQLRLLDVGFPTFDIYTYCTSGSRRYVLFSCTSGSRHLILLTARRVLDVQTQPILYSSAVKVLSMQITRDVAFESTLLVRALQARGMTLS